MVSPNAFELSEEDELVGVKIGGSKGTPDESAESEHDGLRDPKLRTRTNDLGDVCAIW